MPLNSLTATTLSFLALALLLAGCTSDSGPGEGAVPVSFTTQDGVLLSGHLFGEGDVGVVLSHMKPADQESWWSFAQVLQDRGYTALAYDFRGYGDSDGERELDLLDRDVRAAVAFLKDRGASRVFLIGASMGGTASLKIAAQEDVAGVITLSAPTIFEGIDVRDDLLAISAPKLFIAARSDTNGFYARSVDYFDQMASDPKEAQKVDGDDHGTDMLSGDSGPRVQGLMVDFLRRQVE